MTSTNKKILNRGKKIINVFFEKWNQAGTGRPNDVFWTLLRRQNDKTTSKQSRLDVLWLSW